MSGSKGEIMSDLCVTTQDREVEAIPWGSDVAQHAPDWLVASGRADASLTETATFYTARTSQRGFYDEVSRDTERYWQSKVRPPRTALGRRLLELRAKIIAAGIPLLDWDGVEREVQERRGGLGEDDG